VENPVLNDAGIKVPPNEAVEKSSADLAAVEPSPQYFVETSVSFMTGG
jgi:hypothetical protein